MSLQLISQNNKYMPTLLNFGCGNTIKSRMVNVDAHISDTIKGDKNRGLEKCWIYEGLWTDPHEFPVDQFTLIEAFDNLFSTV